ELSGNSQSRSEVVLIRLHQPAPVWRIRWSKDLAGFRIEIRDLIAAFVWPSRVVVPQAIIHSQLRCGFPFVLEEERAHPKARIRNVQVRELRALRIAE